MNYIFNSRFFILFLNLLIISNCINVIAAVTRPKIVILNGISCSGKTSIAEACMKLVDSKEVAFVFVDRLKIKKSRDLDEGECRRILHEATISQIKNELSQGKLVICDTVLDDPIWVDLFEHELNDVQLFFTFIHCPLNILAQRLHERNKQSYVSGCRLNARRFSDIVWAFGRMYSRTNEDFGFGMFTAQDFEYIKNVGPGAMFSPMDWNAVKVRCDVFNFEQPLGDFLNAKVKHDCVFNNYSETLPKEEILNTIAERIVSLLS